MSNHANDAAHRDAEARRMNRSGAHDEHHIDADASPDVIESQIDAKRADISRTLSQLEQRFSPNQMMDYVKDNGGEIADNLGRSFKRNPVPFVLTGIGLAWLMSSTRGAGSDADYDRYRSRYYGDDARDRFDDDYGYDTAYAPAYDAEYSANRAGGVSDTTPYARGGYASGTGTTYATGTGHGSGSADTGDDDGPSLLDKARAKASELGDGIGDGVDSMKRRASSARDGSAEHYERMRTDARYRAETMRRDASRRYASMSASGRDAAYRARRNMKSGMESASDFLQEQPLVAAALGIGIGAVLGALLPATRTEDRYLGEYSDEARDRASDVAAEQAERLRGEAERVAHDASESVQHGLENARKTAESELEKARVQAESGVKDAGAKADEKGAQAEAKTQQKVSDGSTTTG